MSRTPVTLELNTTEYRAALLLEALTEKAKQLPAALPERAEWMGLAIQVADTLAEHMGLGGPGGAARGRGI